MVHWLLRWFLVYMAQDGTSSRCVQSKPVSLEDLPVSIADFISAIWGPKNTLLNGKLGSSPAVTKMASKLLSAGALERLTGGDRDWEDQPRAQDPRDSDSYRRASSAPRRKKRRGQSRQCVAVFVCSAQESSTQSAPCVATGC